MHHLHTSSFVEAHTLFSSSAKFFDIVFGGSSNQFFSMLFYYFELVSGEQHLAELDYLLLLTLPRSSTQSQKIGFNIGDSRSSGQWISSRLPRRQGSEHLLIN